MPDQRWTDETEDAVAAAIYAVGDPTGEGIPWAKADEATRYVYRRRAAAALAAAADLGLLIAPGGKVREDWVAEVDPGDGYKQHPIGYPYIASCEHEIDDYMRGIIFPKRKRRRLVHAGPWLPVTEGDETP